MKITTQQLRKIVREEIGKTRSLNEAAKVKLPKGMSIVTLGMGKHLFTIQYDLGVDIEFDAVKKISQELSTTLSKFSKQLQVERTQHIDLYIEDGRMYIGYNFKSSLNDEQMDAAIDGGLDKK